MTILQPNVAHTQFHSLKIAIKSFAAWLHGSIRQAQSVKLTESTKNHSESCKQEKTSVKRLKAILWSVPACLHDGLPFCVDYDVNNDDNVKLIC